MSVQRGGLPRTGAPAVWPLIGAALLGLPLGTAAQAAQEHVTPADLVEVVDISSLSASPSGHEVVFRTEQPLIARNSEVLRWHAVSEQTGAVRNIGDGGEPIWRDPGVLTTEQPVWAPDERSIYVRALVDGAIGLWRVHLDGSAAEAVLVDDADIVSVEPDRSGDALVVSLGPTRARIARAEQAEYDAGILVDEHVDLSQNLFRGALINGRRASQRLTGYWFARGGLLWREPLRTRRLDLGTLTISDGEPVAAHPAQPIPPDRRGLRMQSAGGDVAEASEKEGSSILQIRRVNGNVMRCTAPVCGEPIRALSWRPGRDELIFTTSDQHLRQTLHLWDLAHDQVRMIARGEGLLSGGRDGNAPCAVTSKAAFCVAAGPLDPPRLVRIDLDSGEFRTLYDPNAALRARINLRHEWLDWTAAGQSFAAVLVTSRSVSTPRPLFLTYYQCGGFLRGGVGDEFPYLTLAAAGFAVACIDAPKPVEPYDAVRAYRVALASIESLVDRLSQRRLIDPTRVGMGGLSFGSEVALWTAIHSDLLAALSIASAQIEPAYYWINGIRGRDHHTLLRQTWRLGAPEETPRRWALVSSAYNVARLRAPILMQLPESEARSIPELYARLSNSPTPTELYAFPDEPHIKVQPRHKLAVYRRNLDWFRFWLQGYVDPDPLRNEQYRRWRELDVRWRQSQVAKLRSQSSTVASSNKRK